MAGELLLVGSIPLDTVEQVFRDVGGPLGRYLWAIQWDLAVENRYVEAALTQQGQAAAQSLAERLMLPACEIAPERPGRLLTEQGSTPPPDIVDVIVADHLQAVELLHEVLQA